MDTRKTYTSACPRNCYSTCVLKVHVEDGPGQQNRVLNGIAYDAENDRLLVTGKLWPRLYEIELVPKE